MANHTKDWCGKPCQNTRPDRCCEELFCDMAEEHAKKHWKVIAGYSVRYSKGLTHLKYMGDQGCILPPHLRPSCTLHVCQINTLGILLGQPAWTRKYFELREKIDEMELKRWESSNPKDQSTLDPKQNSGQGS